MTTQKNNRKKQPGQKADSGPGRDMDGDPDSKLVVSRPKTWAAGLPSLTESIPRALRGMGAQRSLKTLSAMNQKDGFDCVSCAWPDPPDRKLAEFCENGAKAVSWEADPLNQQ